MILNVILLVIGAVSIIYGIKTKLKMWLVIGLILFACGAVSAYVDVRTMGLESITNPNARVPFVIDNLMR